MKVSDHGPGSKGRDWDDKNMQTPDQAQRQTETTQEVEAGSEALTMLPDTRDPETVGFMNTPAR